MSSGTLRHEGEPLASLSGLMECEVLDWQVASTGSERCRGELTVSPTRGPPAAKGTDCSGGKTTRPTNCQTENKWGWTRPARLAPRGGCDGFEWGEHVWSRQKRFCGLTSPRSGETPAGLFSNAAGENRLWPHTRGPPAAKGRTVAGERQRVPQLPDWE